MSVPDWFDERGLFRVHDEFDRTRCQPHQGESKWSKNIDFLRLKDFTLHLLGPRPGMTVLDLGCATGTQMIYCALQGASVYGQDLDEVRVAKAREKLARLNLVGEATVGSATHMTFGDGVFDAVLSSDFHEHLSSQDQIAVLRESRRVLKPGGHLVLKTPNLTYLRAALWFKRLSAPLRLRSPFGYVIPHTPGTWDPEHIGLSTQTGLARQLDAAGFLNWTFHYAPLRRFGLRHCMEVLSTEIPLVRSVLCETLFVTAYKPIATSHFPD
jgi:2-polyprenyl-3-methyl-5-hydroxy-6-metoxy-1,4-benzoquinol methylase